MRLALFALPIVLLTACVTPGNTPPDTDSDTGSTSETTTTETTNTSSTTLTTTSTTTAATTTTTTTGTTGECGDGKVDTGEECDDGADNSDSAACTSECKNATCGDGLVRTGIEACDDGADNGDNAACTSECTVAACGDGKVHTGVEECDDGANDGSYGTCNGDCSLAPHCGDGELQKDHEACEGADIKTGCLDDCTIAETCVDILAQWPDAETGVYYVDPPGAEVDSLPVYCEMDADGGGYTMVKVDTLPPLTGGEAETFCSKYGFRLAVPRSEAHVHALYKFATTVNLPPIGAQDLPASDEYMSILGIYPKVTGESCVSKPFNDVDCPEWRANDDGPYWVSDVAIDTEPSKKNCTGCSMVYTWKADGSVDQYQALNINGGYNAEWFICVAADK